MSPKGRNASRDGLDKIGWVVYSLLFPCIFSLNELLMPFFAGMLRYQLRARFCNVHTCDWARNHGGYKGNPTLSKMCLAHPDCVQKLHNLLQIES